MINISSYSHQLLNEVKNPNVSLDMTCGNGLDTLFLSRISNKVYAFDIQNLAIENTKKLLIENDVKNVTVIKESHDLYEIYVRDKIDLAIYNLGYLPKSDKRIKTESSIVLNSLKKLINQLNVHGKIVIVIYLHDLKESNTIESFTSNLDSKFDVLKHKILNKVNCPYIIEIIKTKE